MSTAAARRVHPTHRPGPDLVRRYRRPGGPWLAPDLHRLLTGRRTGTVVAGPDALRSPAVDDLAARVATGLRADGYRRGDAVAWQLPNSVEALLLYRAAWQLGLVAAPIHHRASAAEREALAASLGAPRCVTDAAEVRRWSTAAPHRAAHARPTDPAVVLFTAGSTGAPKGVLHTHRTLAAKAVQMAGVHGLTPRDTVLMPAPLAHVSGLLNGVLLPALVGMSTVLQARWDPDDALGLIEHHEVSFMVGPPTFFVAMAGASTFSAAKVRSLRLVSSGGAGVTPAFIEDATARFGAVFKRSYGSTEAPTVTTSSAGDPPWPAAHTDGRPTGDTEVRIAADGEVLVRGPELFAGYVDPAHNEGAFARGGWFRTGDLGTVDPDGGWCTITGRKKDVIIRGGENISAGAVEAVLEAHPRVRQAAVIGEPHDVLGERVVAFVVADGRFDLAECRRWFEAQGAARFTTPERIVRRRSLPVLPAGKVDKAALRASLGG